MKLKTPRSLKARALQLLAQREQSRVELRRKLLVHALADDAARIASAAEGADVSAAVGLDSVSSALERRRGGATRRDRPPPSARSGDAGGRPQRLAVIGEFTDAVGVDDETDPGEVDRHTGAGKWARAGATAGTAAELGDALASSKTDGAVETCRADDADAVDDAAPADAARRVDDVLDWLAAHGFLSDERFAESRIHARSTRYGDLRIRHELKQHGVALGAEAASTLRESESSRAWAVWERRFGSAPITSADRARQSRFLTARGFSPDTVRQVLRRARAQSAASSVDD